VSDYAGDKPSTFGDFHFSIRQYGDSHFTAAGRETKGFSTLQPSLKTKLEVQA